MFFRVAHRVFEKHYRVVHPTVVENTLPTDEVAMVRTLQAQPTLAPHVKAINFKDCYISKARKLCGKLDASY